MAVPVLAMLASLVVFRVLLTSAVTTLFVSSLVVLAFMMFTCMMLACSIRGSINIHLRDTAVAHRPEGEEAQQ